ncbi:CapA family protein [Streptomyces sp. P9(2023)]|uniref:CapA family protein n=1 Tax=Streptomyces sp. P9(2023) TaxID=3064394 RepID=UPI0028F3F8D2|nr:CapA family protein [Streptomyces sp. P9(2023)]MDT9688322.1 CapA family protein [Streptomyces sp. P9(2023)]
MTNLNEERRRWRWNSATSVATAVCLAVVGAAGVWLAGGDPQAASQGSSQGSSRDAGGNAAPAASDTPGKPTPDPDARPFTLVATGDVIPYPSIIQRAAMDAEGGGSHDFRKILAGVKPIVSGADLAICHHEIPYGKPGGPYTGYPTFKAPHQLADALKETGYEGCSTASNHTLDAGFEGLTRTLDGLDRVGLKHVGSARDAEEAKAPAWYTAGGAKVAQLSYTYGTNGIPLPQGKPWAVNLTDQRRIIDDARAAREAGAQVVLLSIHWGTEWQEAPDEAQRELAQALTASRTDGLPDIDLVIGTHNHVPQPYEKVNGTWVVYGMGDQVASFVPSDKLRGNMSSIPRFTFGPSTEHPGRWTVTKAEYLTQYSDMSPPFRVVCASCEAPAGKKARYAAVDARVTEAVMSRGAGAQGLTRATK